MLCDVFRKGLLAVIPNDLIQRAFRIIVHDIPRCKGLPGIHTHIQRRVVPVGKASLRVVKLPGGYPEIQHDAVHTRNAERPDRLRRVAVVVPNQRDLPSRIRVFGKALPRSRKSLLILIDPDQPPVLQAPQDLAAVAASAQRAVQVDPVRPYVQSFNCLL